MVRLFTTLLMLASLVLGMTACNKEKAQKTIRQSEELAGSLLIYGRNIARANNESFKQGNISADLHLTTNKLIDKYLQGVDVFVGAIAAAKQAVAAGADPNGQVDILKAVFNAQVVQAGLDLISQVAKLPPDLQDKVGGWAAAIQLAITSFKVLFAEMEEALKVNKEVSYA